MNRYRRILAALVNNVRAMQAMPPIGAPVSNRSRARTFRRYATAALFVVAWSVASGPAAAQVAALVNGTPVTELDIAHRIKIIQVTSHKTASRQEALKALVDDQLKIFICKRYGIEPSKEDVDNAFASMAQRTHATPKQMEEALTRQGMSVSAFKLKLKADVGWGNLIRGKYGASLQINDADIRNAMQARNEADKDKDSAAGNIYTLYPITFVAPNGTQEGARRIEAENLRSRFTSCADGLKLARLLRGVVVRDAVKRGSADLAPELRDVLDKMAVGHLTAPEVTPQGIQMFALCERQESDSDSPAKRAIREEMFSKRFEVESKKYLDEIRRQSMIEYR